VPLPTFVIPGVQKSGTTSLHDLLGRHPRIWVSRPKELHFFDQHRDRGLEWYSAQFTPDARDVAWGESTPLYLYNDRVRTDMARSLPGARYVVMLREPVSRAYSQYWFARSKGVETLPTFAEAVAAEPVRLTRRPDRQPAKFSYLDRGHYLRQLRSLEDLVGRDRILVHLLEDLTADPAAVVQQTCTFLGVDAAPLQGVEPAARNTFAARTLNRAPEGAHVTPDERAEGVPQDAYPPMEADLEQELRGVFREENRALAEWLQRDLSSWL
jgi:Sulfotransferase domain